MSGASGGRSEARRLPVQAARLGLVACTALWATFSNTYSFPSIPGFSEFPAPAGLARVLLLRNLAVAGLALALGTGLFMIAVRTTKWTREGAWLVGLTPSLIAVMYGWSPIARVAWGEPFQTEITLWHTLVIAAAVASAGVGLFRLDATRRPLLLGLAALLPPWLQPHMSYDKLELAFVTSGVVTAYLAVSRSRK